MALALADQKPLCSPFRDSGEGAEKAKAKPSVQLRNWGLRTAYCVPAQRLGNRSAGGK